ncbi:MAG TPA: deoxyribodipyrimidine photo-lyase [Verrucomicrobiales bacterium]|nr:deoxyribodipyrimidine photo-lyase [Verrucomicrobiales bacterium]
MLRFKTVIHWFRRDLRLSDNTALYQASVASEEVVPVYLASDWKGAHHWTGAGRQAFLRGSLESLAGNICHAGGRLFFRSGDPIVELRRLIEESRAEALFLNRDPDPYGKEMEKKVRSLCREKGIEYCDFQDAVLHEAGEVLTGSGNPYKVYTPYSKSWFAQEKPSPVPTVRILRTPTELDAGQAPALSHWGIQFSGQLLREPGEKAARARLKAALKDALSTYAERRNDPAIDATSHLGADLRYGTISVREVYHRSQDLLSTAASSAERISIQTFQKQLAWREFFMAILHHFPEVLETEFNQDWRGLRWDDPSQDDHFEKWKTGRTGFPIVDAGMRQLLETGYMHNRVRMITAMFLTKDLHIHWREGEAHFLQHLLDGEIANNNGGWQWSAGTGADAAPYFRIQNPWTQTARFDPDGRYIKRWLPELEKVNPKRFTAPPEGGARLCGDYFAPIIDHKTEREETLSRFKSHRGKGR